MQVESEFRWQFFITYIFSVSLKFRACYITGPVGRVYSNKRYFIFTYTFLASFCCFSSKICAFNIFISFFDKVTNFRNKILTNH